MSEPTINSALYRNPQMLDTNQHRHKRLKAPSNYAMTRSMHAVFTIAAEFPQVCVEHPIIFVHTGEKLPDGKDMISPVTLLGLVVNENLRVDESGKWVGRYVPAFIRRFPFLTAQLEGQKSPNLFVDVDYEGFSDTEGDPLFDAEGKPTETLKRAVDFVEQFDREQWRTRAFCERLLQLDILQPMTADATMPNGENIKVEGFLSVDEEKFSKLPDATVVELHRNGMLMLLNAHLLSLNHVRELVELKAERIAVKDGKLPAKPAAPAA
ncbi:SapC family protein [Piscinibacter terrae]|nr:SapC family protein [Albitalea terrae]